MAELKVLNTVNLAKLEKVIVDCTRMLVENERERNVLKEQRENLVADKEKIEIQMTNLKMQNILRLGKIGKLTVKNTRLLAENEKAMDVLEKVKEHAAADRQTLLHKIAEEEFVYLAKVETGTVEINRLSDENEKVDRVRERNRWKYIRKGLETALAKAEQDKNQTLEAWKKERGAWARVTACLQSLWDQRGERWMKEKEEVKEKSTQAAANWMTELREKERLIDALEREKMMLLSQHEDEKRGWEMEKSEMEKERLVLTGEWDRKNSEMEKMKKEKDRWVIEKKDMLERMKDAHIQMYHMQTVLRFREQEQTQKETKKAQEAKEKTKSEVDFLKSDKIKVSL
ncbi:golgin subfamily A member 6-like protein 22 [Esox lucius]|uniref:golgin subfamily A member 6-like protein 22 n=1 Tax=Esox lucius TaxID=8010 RepID=UPI0014775A31|nr:golgin subfamily A member 6-like protein 22 [Esox lucius]